MVRKEEFIKLHPEVRTGMEAYDFQGERLGVIERVDDDSITIERGHIFHRDVSLPYDAIEDIREDHVIIRPSTSFEAERMESESEEELERQYERDRSAREEQFEVEREEVIERQGVPGTMETEEGRMGMSEGFEEGEWQESPRREAGLEEADTGGQARAESGWEEREILRGEEEFRVPVREEEVEVTEKPVAKEKGKARKEKRTKTEPVSGEVREEEVKVEPSENVQKK